jgi:hypothetical protein
VSKRILRTRSPMRWPHRRQSQNCQMSDQDTGRILSYQDAVLVESESEGRISVLKRRHGLGRCRYRGDARMQRWVGLGVTADNREFAARLLNLT